MDELQKQYAKWKKTDTKESIYEKYSEKYKLMNTEEIKSSIVGSLGWEWGLTIKEVMQILWCYGNVKKLDCSDSGITLYIYWKIVHLQWMNFMVCKYYFDTAVKK